MGESPVFPVTETIRSDRGHKPHGGSPDSDIKLPNRPIFLFFTLDIDIDSPKSLLPRKLNVSKTWHELTSFLHRGGTHDKVKDRNYERDPTQSQTPGPSLYTSWNPSINLPYNPKSLSKYPERPFIRNKSERRVHRGDPTFVSNF